MTHHVRQGSQRLRELVTQSGPGGVIRVMNQSDTDLIRESVDHPPAFRELYDRWAEPLLAYFYRRVLDAEVAADLLAETFMIAFEKRSRFRDTGAPGGAWLFGIASRELSRYFRRRRVQLRTVERLGLVVPDLDDESAQAIARLVDRDERESGLAGALTQMSPAEREAVELRVVGELEYREIASRLHCTEAAARVRVHRGLARLNQLLEGQ
jgi:RNA polymerase sigma-70 factor (ECF subfamily)